MRNGGRKRQTILNLLGEERQKQKDAMASVGATYRVFDTDISSDRLVLFGLTSGRRYKNDYKTMTSRGKRLEAIGYMRTSSATNVGEGKDSEVRQRKAIEGYAKSAGMVRMVLRQDCEGRGRGYRPSRLCGYGSFCPTRTTSRLPRVTPV